MIGTALALGIGAATSLAGSAISAAGAGKQASAAEKASADAIAEQRRQYDLSRQDLAPWRTAGTNAVNQLAFLLGLGPAPTASGGSVTAQPIPGSSGWTEVPYRGVGSRYGDLWDMEGGGGRPVRADFEAVPQSDGTYNAVPASGGVDSSAYGSLMRDFGLSDFQTDPGYNFRLGEGAKALERSASAKGGLFSGGTLKALTRYNQDFASNEFSNAFNRFQSNRATRYNQLAGLAGLGQTSANQTAALGANTANNIADLTVGGQTAAAAARASGYNAVGNAIGQAGQIPLNWMLLQQLNSRSYPGTIGW